MMGKVFEFKVTLIGRGETEEEAWDNAVTAFMEDPGSPDETSETSEETLGFYHWEKKDES